MSREAMLEQRIQQLESIVNQLQYQNGQGGIAGGGGGRGEQGGSGLAPSEPGVTPTPGAAEGGGPMPAQSTSATGGIGVPGQSFPAVPQPMNRFNVPATLEDKRGKFRFGPGFELATDDDEFILQFHDLTQLDYRGYLQGSQSHRP